MQKKVWVVICEGKTDSDFLIHYHDKKKSNVKLRVYNGDFLMDYRNGISNKNVVSKVTNLYNTEIDKFISSKRVNISDIEKIIYMTDSDKCFEENTNKSNYLYKLANESNLEINGVNIKFEVLILSNNLEHVIAYVDSSKMDGSQKFEVLDVFMDQYEGRCEIDSYFINEGIYPFNSYDEFRNSIYEVIGRMTNLNTIYNEKVDLL